MRFVDFGPAIKSQHLPLRKPQSSEAQLPACTVLWRDSRHWHVGYGKSMYVPLKTTVFSVFRIISPFCLLFCALVLSHGPIRKPGPSERVQAAFESKESASIRHLLHGKESLARPESSNKKFFHQCPRILFLKSYEECRLQQINRSLCYSLQHMSHTFSGKARNGQ